MGGLKSKVRGRLARSLDWRVDAAVRRNMDQYGDVVREMHERADQLMQRYRSFDGTLQIELLHDRDALESLRALVRSMSAELTDQQRAQMELIESISRRLGYLEARPALPFSD